MSKNEHWLLVFMALGANLKISIFDPPSVGGTYTFTLRITIKANGSGRKDTSTSSTLSLIAIRITITKTDNIITIVIDSYSI